MVNRASTSQIKTGQIADARRQAVLSAIIKEHLATGEAVSSQTISNRFAHAAGWSSATIRNVMGELEDAGFVTQPHTSAGRIPSEKGYRFYVDHMPGAARLSKSDLRAINTFLIPVPGWGSPDRLMKKTCHALSELSESVGIVVSPSLAENRLQHIEFLQLADNRILVVLVSASNIVHNKVIQIDEKLSQSELERTACYLNAEYSGKSLLAIRAEILELMRQERALYDRLLHNAILLCDMSLAGEEANIGEVYVDGASNILTKPEFADAEWMRELLRTLEEKSRLVKILNECVARDTSSSSVQVFIGRENTAPAMKNCTVITAPYRIGDTAGAVCVVGPMRIEYARMMAVVNYMARFIERALSEDAAVL